jgi:hypothetical protein
LDVARDNFHVVGMLQVLDNLNVESTELAEARSKYTGRLTREVLEEYLGHKELEIVEVQVDSIAIISNLIPCFVQTADAQVFLFRTH